MLSKIQFDLGDGNRPVIKATVIHSDDVRDKIACLFEESFAGTSSYCWIKWKHGVTAAGPVIEISPVTYLKEDLIAMRDHLNETLRREYPEKAPMKKTS